MIPLRLLVSSDPEPQVLPPGLAHHYSNFGFALIGHVIERVAQIDFAEYVRRAVLAPLEMGSSTFEQPPPPAIRDQLAVGHAWSGTGYRRLPLDYTHVGPADALITTASDMAAFIRFQLGHGSVVLSQPTRDRMHATQFVASPSPYGMAYGFEENVMSKRRVLQHGGAQLGFNSIVVLFPEDDLGVFVAQNAREGNLRSSMLHVIAEELLDARDALQALPPGRPDSTVSDGARILAPCLHTLAVSLTLGQPPKPVAASACPPYHQTRRTSRCRQEPIQTPSSPPPPGGCTWTMPPRAFQSRRECWLNRYMF